MAWDDDHCPYEPGEPDDDAPSDPDGLGGDAISAAAGQRC